jgi:DNA-binding CsgD family transcriptional regulator
METDSSKRDAAHSDYERIVAEYRAAAAQCQASLDQLAAAERELLTLAASIESETQSDLLRDIYSTMGSLSGSRPRLPLLSKRELEVFGLIGDGLTTQEISDQLSIATSTVETYRERLKEKLNLESGNALVRQAVLWAASYRKPSGIGLDGEDAWS